jgi:hypothetical protein
MKSNACSPRSTPTVYVPTEKEFRGKMKQAVKAPSPFFCGFFLAAEWKQKEAFRLFAEFLGWREAMLQNLLSEAV